MLGLDTIKEIAKNPMDLISKVGPSLMEAWKSASDAKDKGWMDKIGIFFSKFSEEYAKLGKEGETITAEAAEAAKQTTEQAMEGATEAVKLDESKVEKADADVYKEALAVGVASMKSLSPEQQAFASKGLDKLTKSAKEGATDNLDLDEFKAVASTGLSTLKALKAKYPDKEKLAAALAQISKASDSSEYPIVGLLKTSVLKVLKPGIGDIISSPVKAQALAKAFGVDISINLFPPGIDHPFKEAFALIKEPELTLENKTKVVTAYRKYIIPNTNESDATKVVDFVHDMVQKKPDQLTTNQLAELVSIVDANDLDRIVGIFTGKTEGVAKVA